MAQHSRPQLRCARRQVQQLCSANFATLPPFGIGDWPDDISTGVAFRCVSRLARCPHVYVVVDCSDHDRHGPPVAARRHHPAAAMARLAVQPQCNLRQPAGRCDRGHHGLPLAVEYLLDIQVDHR